MDYARVYREFISNRESRVIPEGVRTERHHIHPRCLGGDDRPENLIDLTLQDHLFAHLLLARIHGGLLASAFIRMLGQKKYEGRRSRQRFEALRTEAGRLASERNKSWRPNEEQRARHAASYTEERRAEIGRTQSGWIQERLAAGTYEPPAKGMRHSEETKRIIGEKASVSATRQFSDPDMVERVRESNKRTWSQPDKIAEHSIKMRETLSRPEVSARLSSSIADSWNDPVVRERRLEGMRRAREARQESRQP